MDAACLALSLLVAAACLGLGFTGMFSVGESDFDLASTAISAECYHRYGVFRLRGVPLRTFPPDANAPLEGSHLYLHRPATLPLLVGGLYGWLGPKEWVVRLPMLAAGLSTILLLYLLVRRDRTPPAVLGGILCLLATPMFFIFGRSIAFEAIAMPGLLLALLGYDGTRRNYRGSLALCAAGLTLSVLFDWFAFLLLPLMWLGWRWRKSGSQPASGPRTGSPWRRSLLASIGPLCVLSLHVLHCIWASGSVGELLYAVRSRSYGSPTETTRELSWAVFASRIPHHLLELLRPTGLLLVLAGLVLVLGSGKVRRMVSHPLALLAAAQLAYLLLFRNWAIIHGQFLFYSIPLLVASTASLLDVIRRRRSFLVWTSGVFVLMSAHILWGTTWIADYVNHQEWAPSAMGRTIGALVGPREILLAHSYVAPTIRYYTGAPYHLVGDLDEARALCRSGRYRYYLSILYLDDPTAVGIHRWLEATYPLELQSGYLYLFRISGGEAEGVVFETKPAPWWWPYLGSPIHPPIEVRGPGGAGPRS